MEGLGEERAGMPVAAGPGELEARPAAAALGEAAAAGGTPGVPGRPSFVRRWAPYVVKAAVVLGLLGIFAAQASTGWPVFIALLWAALSGLCALGATHRYVTRKLLRQSELKEGGRLARFNNGRLVCMVVSFVLSALLVASLMLDVAAWDVAQWCLAVAAMPLLAVLASALGKRLKGEFEPAFLKSKALLMGAFATLAVLVVASLAVSYLEPVPQVTTAAEAFQEAPQPFADSPSALMCEVGKVMALVDGFSSFGLSQAASVDPMFYRLVRLFLTLGSLSALVGLLATCLLGPSELKRVFLPLEAAKDPSRPQPVMRGCVVMACVLPVALAAGFLAANHAAAQAVQTEEVTDAEAFVRDQVGLAVFVLDGQYYQYQGVQELMDETSAKASQLEAAARAELAPLVNSFFDACLGNVDAYLDWYYSLPADYEQLAQIVTGTAEEFAADQLASHLEEGADATGLADALAGYQEQAAKLEDDFYTRLAELKLEGDVPDWLLTERETIDQDDLLRVLEPAQHLLTSGERLGVSGTAGVAAGVASGVAAKTLVKNAAEKGFFKKLLEKIAGKIGSRALGEVVGGAIGTVAAPGVGTVVGVAAGAAVSTGIDYGALKVDEALNRDAYRQQIVDSIEESRSDMLAALGVEGEPAGESSDSPDAQQGGISADDKTQE